MGRGRRVERRTYHFSGRVQGVGFRYTTMHLARGHPVTGYVRNLPDGRVELVMEGDGGAMDEVLEALKGHMHDNIRRTDLSESAATGEFRGFAIR